MAGPVCSQPLPSGAFGATPQEILEEAAEGFAEACTTLLGVELERTSAAPEANPAFACIVGCSHATGGWNLVVAADRESAVEVTKLMFASDETPPDEEIADALGEVANIAAGALKRRRADSSQEIQICLPLVLSGDGCCSFIGHGIRNDRAHFVGQGLRLSVILVWKEVGGA